MHIPYVFLTYRYVLKSNPDFRFAASLAFTLRYEMTSKRIIPSAPYAPLRIVERITKWKNIFDEIILGGNYYLDHAAMRPVFGPGRDYNAGHRYSNSRPAKSSTRTRCGKQLGTNRFSAGGCNPAHRPGQRNTSAAD